MAYLARHCQSLTRGAVGDGPQVVPAPATSSAPALASNEVLDSHICLQWCTFFGELVEGVR